jgi:uncharacterized protein DUF5947
MPRAVESCEMCSAGLGREHPHLIEPETRRIVCACIACALLFDGGANSRFRRIPRDAQYLQDFEMTDTQWENLRIPINMAFFFHSSPEGKMIALYPSPAGAVESLLPLEAWSEIAAGMPAINSMRPGVEALLVNRVGQSHAATRAEYYIAPIDVCYKLVGLIRTNWRGLSGGSEVWSEIGQFFSNLKSNSEVTAGTLHA